MIVLGATAVLAAASAFGAQRGEEPVESRGFAIPDTRASRALIAAAEEHVEARRWPEAVRTLQEVLEDHTGDLLGAVFRPGGVHSGRPVHEGAARAARRMLFELPDEALESYRQAYESDARLLLADARANGDRAGLSRLAERYPATRSAELAWWCLGDLELETGNLTEGLLAWSRALEYLLRDPEFEATNLAGWKAARARIESFDEVEHAARRIDFVLASYAGEPGALELPEFTQFQGRADRLHSGVGARQGREVRLFGPHEEAASVPSGNPGSWPEQFALRTDGPFFNAQRNHLHAVRSGDLVLISDSMRVTAVNAYSGVAVWESDAPPGWEAYWEAYDKMSSSMKDEFDFFKGLDRRYAMIAPAADDSVVVAALQVPVTHRQNTQYQRIKIMRIIPDRRLFAFDLETGRPLWDHMPPEDWDGEAGEFEDRMRVCGPPVIAGGRVLVPTYRLQGRLDYHIGCFDLATGERLWSTAVISGQRELNMFGRQEFAFSAPPLCVEGDKVLALTQLGSVAALDLFSGTLLWETLYDQIDIPPAHMQASLRSTTWRNAPPVVAGDVVLATPLDSYYMLGLDLETGALLWSLNQAELRRRGNDVDLLLGATRNTVYLAGPSLLALSSPVDLRTRPAESWDFSSEALQNETTSLPWPAVGDQGVLVPTRRQRTLVDRHTGQQSSQINWVEGGNVLLSDGAYFTLNNRFLNGYFEWETLLTRARDEVRGAPDDPALAIRLTRLLTDRGLVRLRDGQAELARPYLEEARRVLEPFLDRPGYENDGKIAEQMHSTLRTQAQMQRYLADPGALATLRRARRFAPNVIELRDTLLEEEALLRDDELAPWLEVMERLESDCKQLEVLCEYVPPALGRDAFDIELVPRLDVEYTSAGTRLTVPVELWVLVQRSRRFARELQYEKEFGDLHRILERYAGVDLVDGSAFDFASGRISAALREGDGRGYARYEARARELLDRAREGGGLDSLKLVARYYPHSEASRAAHDLMLQTSLEAGDATSVARIVLAELSEDWDLRRATARELELLCSLASSIGEQGNRAFHRGLVTRLAEAFPSSIVAVEGFAGRTLSEVARELPSEVVEAPPSETATFDSSVTTRQTFGGSWTYHGEVPGATQDAQKLHQVALFSSRHTLMALSSVNPWKPLWEYSIYESQAVRMPSEHVAFAEGRVILCENDWIIGLDRETGEIEWSWEAVELKVEALVSHGGVVLARMTQADGEPLLQALDAHSGIELWQLRISETEGHSKVPLVGSGRVVFVPEITQRKIVVRDLYTGTRTTEFELPQPPERNAHLQMWIEDGLLIQPHFFKATKPNENLIVAYDLETGRERWSENFDEEGRRELTTVLEYDGEHYLVLRPRSRSAEQDVPGQILHLHAGFGALQPVGNVRLGKRDIPIEVPVKRTYRLPSPYVFFRTSSEDELKTRVRAIHLPHGERWVHSLPVAETDLYSRMTLPALSDSTVVLAYNEWPGNKTSPGVTIMTFIDRASGLSREVRDLPNAFPRANQMQFVTLGDALILVGGSRMDVLE